MLKRLAGTFVLGAFAASVATLAHAQVADFATVDADQNGQVSFEELSVAGVPVSEEVFQAADANQDSVLDEAEFSTLGQ
ncbi:MAG: hypothetical protein K5905_23095 [Roseibium sp.]|uniref:hypothetical protein n=1 Tax=Roseibium sp. TaxID=1936156 RepID=UPI00261A4FD6|nr:hypothetical protein [Roseibium sp.]MCV0428354.1 hypothetical protein [Roseibium sp.]